MVEDQEVVGIKPGFEKPAEKEEEKKIPVFTVLKNNSILKNIFLIGSPPPAPSSSSSSNLVENKSPDTQVLEEILVVGRHPDCNITLEHPSISRFHLRIYSLPSKQSLSVIDFSSAHGTWVCGKKIAPGVRVELHDGDILQLGGSSRIYRLHWIPLSHAYVYDNPFMPMVEESETGEEKEETHQDTDGPSLQLDGQIQMEADDLLPTGKNIKLETEQLTPSAPPMPEHIKSPLSYEEEAENDLPLDYSKSMILQPDLEEVEEGEAENGPSLQHGGQIQMEADELLFTDQNIKLGTEQLTPSPPPMPEGMKSPLSYEEDAENDRPLDHSKSVILQPDLERVEEGEAENGPSLQHDCQIQMEVDDLLFTDKNIMSETEQLTPSPPPVPEDLKSRLSYEEETENDLPLDYSKSMKLQHDLEQDEEGEAEHGPSLQHDGQVQMEVDDFLFTDKNIMSETEKLTPPAPPMPEDMKSPLSYEEEAENDVPLDYSKSMKLQPDLEQDEEGISLHLDERQTGFDLDGLDLLFSDMFRSSEKTSITTSASLMHEDMESPFSYKEEAENDLPLDYSKSMKLQPDLEQDEEGKSLNLDERQTGFDHLDGLDLLFSDMFGSSEKTPITTSASLMHEDVKSRLPCDEEAENQNSCCRSEISGLQPVLQIDRVNSILDAAIASGMSQHESPESSILRPHLSSGRSIWKRRGKTETVSVRVQTSRAGESRNKSCADFNVKSGNHENLSIEWVPEDPLASEDAVKELFSPDKENCTPSSFLKRSLEKFGLEKGKLELGGHSIMSCFDEDKEESFTPDKENITPNTLLSRSLKKLEKLDGIRCPKSYTSSPLKITNSGVHQVDKLGSSRKENHARKLLQEKKPGRSASRGRTRSDAEVTLKGNADRVPFQPLLASPNNISPETINAKAATRSCSPINNQQIKESSHHFRKSQAVPEESKKWTMVVDAACLLNKVSRKALQLLQGLQWTNLIIPGIVIRELDCMNRRGSLFRRKNEASSALEWIEDCMVNARSWIHVQSSFEDVRQIATTPRAPASPLSPFSEEIEKTRKFSSVPFSPSDSWLDIVSPTTEDHILECALFFRRIKNNGRLVLLSNNLTLKIKAMAEGLLCETAEDFRQSLVNPFSERFLWTDSSPRGPTWSCVDDVVLREKYYNNPPIQKQSKSGEGAKGLKLILLHNSHFRQISSVR